MPKKKRSTFGLKPKGAWRRAPVASSNNAGSSTVQISQDPEPVRQPLAEKEPTLKHVQAPRKAKPPRISKRRRKGASNLSYRPRHLARRHAAAKDLEIKESEEQENSGSLVPAEESGSAAEGRTGKSNPDAAQDKAACLPPAESLNVNIYLFEDRFIDRIFV